jgi:hypothetical protein
LEEILKMELLRTILLWIHIPAGTLSLILFWIPVSTKKGGKLHRQVGRYYYWIMWVVVITATLLSITNLFSQNYISAAFLGFLGILTAYPLWYSYEILQQKGEWSDRYFSLRKIFSWVLFLASLGMLIGAILLSFRNEGILMAFFGLIGIPAVKDAVMSKSNAMDKEKRIAMHVSGTIISGIAAYTAFLAFGGRVLFVELLPGYYQILPWILPTIIGTLFINFQKRKFA